MAKTIMDYVRRICYQIGLRRGASRRDRAAYKDVRERASRRATKYQVDLMSKVRVASRTPGTCGGRLWLLPSGPDQVHHHAMRGGPPLFVALRAYMRTHYICERRLCGKRRVAGTTKLRGRTSTPAKG